MKIAIQGHPFRGKEVVEILKSFGGKSVFAGLGFDKRYYYYINSNDMIRESLITIKTKEEFKLYTLEEFEKEFPFKVGDLCIYYSDILDKDVAVKILGMTIENDCIMYEVGNRSITKKHSYIYKKRETLRPYKEMKEERNITLTLEKAKEWYKRGGELKEIALQAFTEKELNPLPRSWEEFCKQCNPIASWRYTIPAKYEAFYKLEQLRDCWRQRNIPQEFKYKIRKVKNEYEVLYGIEESFLSFCDRQTAEEFLKCFKDLIEKAGDLI